MTTDDRSTIESRGSFQHALESSLVVTRFSQSRRTLESSWRSSKFRRLVSVLGWLTSVVGHSFIYNWLIKEPESEVIVVNFRESRTVWPLFTVIGRCVTIFAPAWRTTRLRRATKWFAGVIDIAFEARTGQLLAILFLPPEPCERDSDHRD